MALSKVPIAAGFNKQFTSLEAKGTWVDGDFVRFRYGAPEKIGGWESLVKGSKALLSGVARDMHVWTDLDGRKYAAIGTDKVLAIYYEGAFYDITPLWTDNYSVGANITTVNGSQSVTITTASAHNLEVGNIVTFANAGSFTSPDTDYTASDFDSVLFEIQSLPTAKSFIITMPTAETGTGATNDGTLDVRPYEPFGPTNQLYGYGWGTGSMGGGTGVTATLNGALLNDNFGTGGSGTTINLNSTTGFPTTGIIKVDNELISYTGASATSITGITRAVNGTSTAAHSDGSTVEVYTAWGSASLISGVVLDPANWSLDNYGQILLATNHNGKTFTWDPSASGALTTRATIGSGQPTKSVMTVVSDRDRHVFHLGTETTIGNPSTQDKMFIRFSDQEDMSDYTPTSINTAGTFQLDDGTRIVGSVKGKDYLMIFTDTASYVAQFVGPPFTFSIRKVASNAGLLGQHAAVYANGAVFWMGRTGGFYMYDGTVKALPCLVEDFVFSTDGAGDLGINYDSNELVYAGINELFSEVSWFYPSATSNTINRVVTYNFAENVWTTGSLDRTTWEGSTVYQKPFATDFINNVAPTFPTINGTSNGCTVLYEHEKGNNQVYVDSTESAIAAYVTSGEFDLDVEGNGEYFMSISRFVPDFKSITGNADITIYINKYPQSTAQSSPLGPFTITSTTEKVDTRARGRLAAVKIANTGLNETWRYGTFRFDVRPDGRR